MDMSGITENYACLIETTDEHQNTWWNAEAGNVSGGIEESHGSPPIYALAVMNRYLDRMRASIDDYDAALSYELHVRVSVWRASSVTDGYASAPRPGDCPPGHYGRLLTESRLSPHAVEIRTPIQVRQHIYGNGVTA
jgi:hypothetical protein